MKTRSRRITLQVEMDVGDHEPGATAGEVSKSPLADVSNSHVDAPDAATGDDEVFGNNEVSESLPSSDSKENKESRSFMKRMLGGRTLRSRSSSKLSSSSKCSKDGGSATKSQPIQKPDYVKKMGQSGRDSKTQLTASAPRTRQQLSRSQLLSAMTVTSPLPSSQSSKTAAVSRNSQHGAGMKNENVPKKNFVKANVLAAANSKVKSATYLEVPCTGPNIRVGNMAQSGKKFGSSKSLNSDPGTCTSGASSFSRGSADLPQRKSYHHARSINSNYNSGSATLSRNFGKQKI